jgi:hypothetical protein
VPSSSLLSSVLLAPLLTLLLLLLRLQVPGFVKEGDIVVLRPATGEFIKRKL